MYRIPIRDTKSERAIKPRIFDVLIDEKGNLSFEVKIPKRDPQIVSFEDVLEQIRAESFMFKDDIAVEGRTLI